MRQDTVIRPRALLPLLALPLLFGCQPPEKAGTGEGAALDTAAVTAAIDTLRQEFLEAYNAANADALAALYTDDAVFLPADSPPVDGRDSIRAFFRRELAAGPTLEVDPHEVVPLSPSWTSSGGIYRVTVTPEGTDEPVNVRGSYLLLFHETAEGWKLYRHAGTYDSVPPTPGGQ